jgi:exodeoxyribonuclease III
MLIATWNVNSIKAHLDAVLAWVKEAKPDVLCLQEIKCEDHAFPAFEFSAEGYVSSIHGQKTYNGVAILSKSTPLEVKRGIGDDQARYIDAVFPFRAGTVRVAGLYLPNGNPTPGPKYDYKLDWMSRLHSRAEELIRDEECAVLCGDYNVIPGPLDAKNWQDWQSDALYLPPSRAAFQRLLNSGYRDALASLNPALAGAYTFWDYQAGAWQKNNGIRIDHHLLSPAAADCLAGARIDKHVRAWDKPSDHVPVVIELQ